MRLAAMSNHCDTGANSGREAVQGAPHSPWLVRIASVMVVLVWAWPGGSRLRAGWSRQAPPR